MNARWKMVALGALVPVLATAGIALAQRGDSDHRQGDRGERRAEKRHGHRGGALGIGLLRKLTFAELHIREDGRHKVLRVDKGRLESSSPSRITLKANDGNTVTVAVDDDTLVLPGRLRRGGGVTDIREGRMIIAVHEAGKPARVVAAPRRRRWRRHAHMGRGPGPRMGFRHRGERR